jgi:superkiller protein 3
MKPDDWLCSYFIAEVKQGMGLFEEAITILHGLRETRPNEAGILALLGRTQLELGLSQISDGFQVRAEESFVNAIQVALHMIEHTAGFRTIAWKIVGDAAFQLSYFSDFVNGPSIGHALRTISFPPFQDTAEDIIKIVPTPKFQKEAPLTTLEIIAVAIHSYLAQISLYSLSQTTNSGAWYDLSVALQSWIKKAPSLADISSAKDKVVEYLKKALQLDPANHIYWVGLGNAYFLPHAKAAQHAYIKALELDSKNPSTWVKLGLLYLYHGDVELANEAMYRAQVLDPDNTLAWVGQFLIAMTNGDTSDASQLLEHAVSLPTPVVSRYQFKGLFGANFIFLSPRQIMSLPFASLLQRNRSNGQI